MDKIRLERQIKKFEEYMMVDKGLSEITVEGYCRCMSIALRRMRTYNPNFDEIKQYILWMYKEKYSYSHVVNSSLAIEHFTTFKGTAVKLGRPRKPKRVLKEVLSESEISRLFGAAVSLRQKAIIAILSYSGIRNKEICNLRVCDVDIGENRLRVLGGKGFADRYTNISGECTKIIVQYLTAFPRGANEFLFTSVKQGMQMKTSAIRKHIRTLALRAGLQKRVYPHLLRHSLAANLRDRGASLLTVKQQLGHAHYETTLYYYANASPRREKAEYEFCRPDYVRI